MKTKKSTPGPKYLNIPGPQPRQALQRSHSPVRPGWTNTRSPWSPPPSSSSSSNPHLKSCQTQTGTNCDKTWSLIGNDERSFRPSKSKSSICSSWQAKRDVARRNKVIHHMVLLLAPGSARPRVLPAEMDSHGDHMGQGSEQRQHSPSGNRHLMMPPYSSLPTQHHYQGADIPSTNKPSPVPVTTASLFSSETASTSNSSSLCFLSLPSPFSFPSLLFFFFSRPTVKQ